MNLIMTKGYSVDLLRLLMLLIVVDVGSIPINRGLIQAIPTSLPPQPIGEATKASNLQRIPPGVQGRSYFTYFYIKTLTLEQYLALDLNNTRRRFTCPVNSTFEVKGQLRKELRKISFSYGPSNSAVEHISNVLKIASIFNAQESTLIHVFLLTLEGIAKRWFERTSTECTKSWSDLKQNFIRRFCPPAMIFKQLSEIQNFKQEEGKSIFDSWERYNDLLFKCPFHDLNDHQKVNTFYNGLNSQIRRAVDSNGLIPGLTTLDELKSIQKLVEHLHKWHCEENHMTTLDLLLIITEKLKLLNHEMEELKVDFHKLNTDDDIKSYYAEVKSIRSSKINFDKTYTEPTNRPTNLKEKFKQCLKLEQKVNHLAQLISTHKPKHTLMPKTETFGEKVKRRILEENKEPTTTHEKPKQQLQKVFSHEIKELPALYSATFQNKLPPKETDPVSFILPCIIGNHSMRNALADLGARIKENVLVKISNFVFPVDFIVLDIMEDENVLIILGMPMLVTAHAKIDVYGKKISLGVGNDQVRDFKNYLSPKYESQDIISLSPSESVEIKEDFSMKLCDPDKRMSIGLEEFVDIDDMWDDLDPGILTNEKAKTEPDNLQLSCKIGEFVEKGLTEVLFGHPFKEQIGLVEDRSKGTLWFKSNPEARRHLSRLARLIIMISSRKRPASLYHMPSDINLQIASFRAILAIVSSEEFLCKEDIVS
ncbi:hypothetical protein Tco_0414794 [Tanacetum coccineum]